MAEQPPPSSVLPWAWVIEALASFREVDVITLIYVFNRSPKITSNVGSNAREIVSFRILERLFDPVTQPLKSAAQKSGVSFDFSERCENVLQHILGEMHEPNIWDESEKSKWHAWPFIEYKRSCFLSSDLKWLKDTLVERKPSYLTSLKQMVTSRHLNQDGTKIRDTNGLLFNNEQQNPCISDEVFCQDASNEEKKKREDGDYVEQSSKSKSSNDDEWYHKELNDILAKKHSFLSSNCKDRERVAHSKDANCCMKCNKGGRLLVCSYNACLFVFHDSCLLSTTPFDYDPSGKFYCPFCKYSQAISDYWEAKKKVSLARNRLASFSKKTKDNVGSQIPNGASNPGLVNESSETSGNEISPDYINRFRFKMRKKARTDLYVPQIRRLPVPWTQLEEETLKKWVEKFNSAANGMHDRGFPWRKILELGASKFQKGRTPIDLKDKWRNMQKASRKSS